MRGNMQNKDDAHTKFLGVRRPKPKSFTLTVECVMSRSLLKAPAQTPSGYLIRFYLLLLSTNSVIGMVEMN